MLPTMQSLLHAPGKYFPVHSVSNRRAPLRTWLKSLRNKRTSAAGPKPGSIPHHIFRNLPTTPTQIHEQKICTLFNGLGTMDKL